MAEEGEVVRVDGVAGTDSLTELLLSHFSASSLMFLEPGDFALIFLPRSRPMFRSLGLSGLLLLLLSFPLPSNEEN